MDYFFRIFFCFSLSLFSKKLNKEMEEITKADFNDVIN